MSPKKMMLAVAAAALVVSPAVAQVAGAPVVAPLKGKESKLEGNGIVMGILAAGAIITGVVVAATSKDNEVPISN